tara:strand:+ start:2765 stop:3628 length:864 start_codon:yes stop_codon:yes gene_type:complete
MKSGNNNSSVQNVSVVVCAKDEETRIEDCLRSVDSNDPGEIIVVDGGSSDRTVEIAKNFTHKVIVSKNSNLTRDRQIGIDAASKEFIAMIDSDHRLDNNSLELLLHDLNEYHFDMVQSQLISFENNNFWNFAEEQAWHLTHNKSGPQKMIGVAPAMFKREMFDRVRFDDTITETIDDTDFVYRISKINDIKFGIGRTKVKQLHFGSLRSYVKKFKWYGIGDGEFCLKHPNRAFSMIFHLMIRYPVIYPFKAIFRKGISAIPYFVLQGFCRSYGLLLAVFGKRRSSLS